MVPTRSMPLPLRIAFPFLVPPPTAFLAFRDPLSNADHQSGACENRGVDRQRASRDAHAAHLKFVVAPLRE